MTPPADRPDLETRLAELKTLKGKAYWRSLEELAQTDSFKDYLHREFPRQASVWDERMSRRQFLQLMSASLALAGLSACSVPPRERIAPYVVRPEDVIPGRPLYFATAMPLAGYSTGLLVESHEGRPTKVEGHPDHPDSLGATDVFARAAPLTLYDPDRSQTVSERSRIRPWEDFVAALTTRLAGAGQGAGPRILTETISSPSLAALLRALLDAYPQARWTARCWPLASRSKHSTGSTRPTSSSLWMPTCSVADRATCAMCASSLSGAG